MKCGFLKSPCLLSFLAGFLAAFAFPPFNLVPLLFVSFSALYFLVSKAQTGRGAFAIGWSFSFGLLIPCFYWIAGALFVDIKSFWWIIPFAVAGLPALCALFYGLASLAAWKWGLHRKEGFLVFALFWFLADMGRAHLFTGFPWDIMGYVWADILPMLQITSVIGIDGLTFLTLLAAFLPASFFLLSKKKAAIICALGVIVLSGVYGWGEGRLSSNETEYVPNVMLRLVNPMTDQKLKWRADKRYENLKELVELTFKTPGAEKITHFIWPETATSFYLAERPKIRIKIASLMPEGAQLLTGGVVRRIEEDETLHYYNSFLVIDDKGTITSVYDKHHLVPFGEYMPFRSLLPFKVITALQVDFTSGEKVRSLHVPGLSAVGPLICYEAIFSGEVSGEEKPSVLINVTNDAWYEGTIGPKQHFLIARVRAIEEGVPLVRVANRGISGVIDSLGRINYKKTLDRQKFLDSPLPRALEKRTIFKDQGDSLVWLITLGLLLLLVLLRRVLNFR